MADFRMPSLGADMTQGTLLEWRVRPGDTVHRGDIVAVVDTDKAAIEVECFDDGVVDQLLVDEGTKVPVGTPLAHIGAAVAAGAPVTTASAQPPGAGPAGQRRHHPSEHRAAKLPAPVVESPLVRHLAHELGVDLASLTGTGPEGAITREDVMAVGAPAVGVPPVTAAPRAPAHRASPFARRRAAELGVDLASVTGSGDRGTVTAADVEAAARSAARLTTIIPTPAAPAGPGAAAVSPTPTARGKPDTRRVSMQRTIGQLMARSKREIPHYYLSTTVDFAAADEWLREANRTRPVSSRLVPAALILKACATAALEVPSMNGWWVDEDFQPSQAVHLGVAISLRGSGLIAPALLDADRLDLDRLMANLQDLVGRARSGLLRSREMSDGTLTVTNLGENGAESVLGVIYAPQVALVGVGRVHEQPMARDGLLGVRPVITVTLAGDHRVSDGHQGSRYLAAVDALLQAPEKLRTAARRQPRSRRRWPTSHPKPTSGPSTRQRRSGVSSTWTRWTSSPSSSPCTTRRAWTSPRPTTDGWQRFGS